MLTSCFKKGVDNIMTTRQAYLSMDFWDIANKDASGNTTGSSQYTHLNVMTYPKKVDENHFGHQVVKFDCDKAMFNKMRQLGLQLHAPCPCDLDVDYESGSNRKAKMFCTDIDLVGQSLLHDTIDLTKLPTSSSKFDPMQQLQGAMGLADKAGYNLMDARIIPLRILGMTKRKNQNGSEHAQVYIASYDIRPNTAQHVGFVLTKGDANPTLVPKLKTLVPEQEIKLKFFECVGICYARRGSKESDNFYLADIFYQGSFLAQASGTPAQKKSSDKSK